MVSETLILPCAPFPLQLVVPYASNRIRTKSDVLQIKSAMPQLANHIRVEMKFERPNLTIQIRDKPRILNLNTPSAWKQTTKYTYPEEKNRRGKCR